MKIAWFMGCFLSGASVEYRTVSPPPAESGYNRPMASPLALPTTAPASTARFPSAPGCAAPVAAPCFWGMAAW